MASVRLFQHNNFEGDQILISNPGHERYLLRYWIKFFLNGKHELGAVRS